MTKHGLSQTKIYDLFWGMINRCIKEDNKAYRYYKEKGIKVCDEWMGFDNFLNFYNWSIENGYKDGLQLDRIDSNGNYEPKNCRWVTPSENARNQKIRSDNKSGHKGINYDKQHDKWNVRISVNGKRKFIGRFKEIQDAIDARNKAEIEYWSS